MAHTCTDRQVDDGWVQMLPSVELFPSENSNNAVWNMCGGTVRYWGNAANLVTLLRCNHKKEYDEVMRRWTEGEKGFTQRVLWHRQTLSRCKTLSMFFLSLRIIYNQRIRKSLSLWSRYLKSSYFYFPFLNTLSFCVQSILVSLVAGS